MMTSVSTSQSNGIPVIHTVAYLRFHVPEFILLENCSSDTLDLNPVDYSVWRALDKMEYCSEISDIDRLKRVLIDCWTELNLDH